MVDLSGTAADSRSVGGPPWSAIPAPSRPPLRPRGAGRPSRWKLLGVGVVAAVAAASRPQLTMTVVALGLQAVFLLFFLRHFAFAIAAMRAGPIDLARPPLPDRGFTPRVSVLVACKNEIAVVHDLVAGLFGLDYPPERLQLIVVDDGSNDGTGGVLAALARNDRRLVCIHRPPWGTGGKASALNQALEVADGDIVVVFDADHRPLPDSVRRLVCHFRDPSVGAVQGRCEIHNADDSIVARLIAVDYLAGYLVNEYGRQSLFQLPAYGGANCAVRASTLRAVGGWNDGSVTEDTDLTLRLVLRGARVRYDVHAVDREEGVGTLGRFWRQRYRWALGHQQVCRDYRRLVWRSPRLSLREKVETTMFLFVFHLPIASALGLVTATMWAAGLAAPVDPLHAFLLWTLLFLGPLLELGAGLLVAGADRKDALALAFFLPLFFLSMALCTKAWLDAAVGRRYRWAKTARAREVAPRLAQ